MCAFYRKPRYGEVWSFTFSILDAQDYVLFKAHDTWIVLKFVQETGSGPLSPPPSSPLLPSYMGHALQFAI